MNARLTGSNQPVPLGPGYSIRAPGWVGHADIAAAGPAGQRSAPRAGPGLDALDDALAAGHLTETRRIDLQLQPQAGAPASLRGASGVGEVALDVPDPGPDHAVVVLSVDDAGAVRWHLPQPQDGDAAAPAMRGGGAVRRFRIPAELPPRPAGATAAQQRSLFGAVSRRLLKVLVYPITDPVTGAIGRQFARHWEERKRPHRLRLFRPGEHRRADLPAIDAATLEAMAGAGPVLLFVHGTFSTSHGGFGDLPDDTLHALHGRYADRVIAFDHPTLHADPADNVRWLLRALPARPMTLDIVSHSRGGLVARTLAERPAAFALDAGHVEVRRIVFAATPNAGTILADPDHMVQMIDRLTTALTLMPSGPVTETLEALVTVVKMLGHGVLGGLDGLAAMRPRGEFLGMLNTAGPARDGYHAIAADYEPTDGGLRTLLAGAADKVLDMVFGDAANDLVVPTAGVHQANGGAGFPIVADRMLGYDAAAGVMHTNLFGQPAVSQHLLRWLQ